MTIQEFKHLKTNKNPFAMITAYDFISAQIVDELKIPAILVGDSASMMIYGYDNTIPISIDEMLLLVRAVTRGAKKTMVIADMPFQSYQVSIESAINNACRFLKEGRANAVKLEGGSYYCEHIKAIINSGVPVMGHIGLLPQSVNIQSGYKVQGKKKKDAQKIFDDACALEQAGVFAVVLEGLPEDLSHQITDSLSIPTIGIGAGRYCDGQIQVYHDVLGLLSSFQPKHSKQFIDLHKLISQGLNDYKKAVESNKFPSSDHIPIVKKQN